MTAELILKSSSVEDKRPTPAQLAVSEIGLNYNEAGAFLTCKDSAGNIQQIGGVKISETAPSTPVKQTVWFQPSAGTLSIFDGSSWLAAAGASVTSVNGQTGVVVLDAADVGAATAAQGALADLALQPGDDISELNNDANYLAIGDNVSALANDAGYITDADVSGNYLSLDAAAGAQVVESTDVTEFKGGLLIPDGEDITLTDGANSCTISTNSSGTAAISSTGSIRLDATSVVSIAGSFSADTLMRLTGKSTAPWSETSQNYFFINPRIDDTPIFNESDPTTLIGDFSCSTASIYYGDPGVQNPNIKNKYGLRLNSAIGTNTWAGAAVSNSYGVYSELIAGVQGTNNVYNFFAAGSAPNWFAAALHIGGDTTGDSLAASTKLSLKPNGSVSCAGINFAKGGTNLAVISYSGIYYSNGNNVYRAVQSVKNGVSIVSVMEIIPYAYDSELDENIDITTAIGLDIKAVKTSTATGDASVADEAYGIKIGSTAVNKLSPGGSTYALYSAQAAITSNGSAGYNVYVQGTAPSYFGGFIRTGQVTNPGGNSGGTADPATDDNPYGWEVSNGNSNAVRIINDGLNMAKFSANGATANVSINRLGNANGSFIAFAENGIPVDRIKLDGSGGITYGTSDYRLKENVVDLPSSIEQIKQLRPVNYNFISHPGKTRPGFIAHELAAVIAPAVTGEKDEEESIGNFYDYDGSLIEAHIPEPSEDQMSYEEEIEEDGITTTATRRRSWILTGTQPVYQTADQTKIIPHLVNALQEALEKIESLEQRLNAAGM